MPRSPASSCSRTTPSGTVTIISRVSGARCGPGRLERRERGADMATTTNTTTAPAAAPSIKTRQQAMWASGDFAVIGTTLQIVGELLCEAVDLRAAERVLDVAAGNGNAT